MSGTNLQLEALFNLIDQVLMDECGDGDVHVRCKYYNKEQLADLYDRHLSQKTYRPRRYPYNPDHKLILFSDGCNENVVFSDIADKVEAPSWVTLEVTI